MANRGTGSPSYIIPKLLELPDLSCMADYLVRIVVCLSELKLIRIMSKTFLMTCTWHCSSLDEEPDSDWANKLVLTVHFSTSTNKIIEEGMLGQKERVEITTAVSTLMLAYTARPTPSDLTTISQRLVETNEKLRDRVDNGYLCESTSVGAQ